MTQPLSNDSVPTPPQGSVYIELRVEKNIPLSRIIQHWTVQEAEALVAGDPEAREALLSEAARLALSDPDEVDRDVSQIHIEAPR